MKSLSIFLFSWVGLVASARADELSDLLARARAASGIEAFRAQAGGRDLVLHGAAQRFGVAGEWTLRLASDGRFVRDVTGELPSREGCDGTTAWHVDATGMPVVAAFALREQLLLEASVELGAWCLADGPVAVLGMKTPSPADASLKTLRLRVKDGVVEVELDVDAKSALPRALRWSAAGEPEHWSFEQWRAVGGGAGAVGLTVPGRVDFEQQGVHLIFDVGNGELAAADADAAAHDRRFLLPTARPADTSFDPAVAARLVYKRARTGHLLVKAKLGGQELGWVVFDSGAGSSGLAPKSVDALHLAHFGETRIGGGGAAQVVGHFVRGASLAIGPVTIEGLVWHEFDLSGLEQSFGAPLAGIVGYDLLQRTVAVADMKSGAVDLYDPTSFTRADVVWSPLILHGNHAHVRATFEHDGEEEGIFRLDTGAPGVTILFHSPAVRSLGLLEGNQSPPLQGLGGIGGQMRARAGTLDGLKIGGKSFDHPRVIFCEDEVGAMADPWSTGTMGGGILEDFDLIFDYPHGRVGFVAHAPAK
jgi:hypothetical protein